jgi:hypothetical protein
MDPLSGPKGSPNDAKKVDYSSGTPPGWTTTRILQTISDTGNCSTGALSTGIGISTSPSIVIQPRDNPQTAAQAIFRAGFSDNDIPGQVPTYSAGGPPPVVASSAVNSTKLYIGGGRSIANAGTTAGDRGRPMIPSPYTANVAIVGAGQGATRDQGAGPAFTGLPLKMVTNTGSVSVANGAAIETGFNNRSGGTLVVGASMFGTGAALGVPS